MYFIEEGVFGGLFSDHSLLQWSQHTVASSREVLLLAPPPSSSLRLSVRQRWAVHVSMQSLHES